VVTVCDRAHEEIDLPADALHWSIPDPVGAGDPAAFDRAADAIEHRIDAVFRRTVDAADLATATATATATAQFSNPITS
jgi:ArsR family transcriptional regulator, arsenate/arsenite/antimonite-responsive transcriptional repressor / arsenate reductase (thioredoxin)